MCVSQVSVCAKLLLTLMTLPSLAQQAVTPPVFKRHSYQIPIRTCTHEHTQKHTHTHRGQSQVSPKSWIFHLIQYWPAMCHKKCKKATTLLNIINLLTKNYARRLYMYVMTSEAYIDVKSNIIYHKHWQMWGWEHKQMHQAPRGDNECWFSLCTIQVPVS